MKRIKQVMLFTALLILLIGAVTASDTTNHTTVTNEETQTALQDTTQVSQTDTTQEKNNNNNEIIINTKQETPTTKNIQKNTNKANTKTETEKTVNNWTTLNETINTLKTATENTTITLNPGTYTAEGLIDWNNTNIILTIDGNGQTINANQHQAFYIQSRTTVILKNIIITNATKNDGYGGAINNHGTITITNTTLNNNTAQYGGAINNNGTLTITNTTLTHNTATWGGAINNHGTITITNHTTLQYNTAQYGGAIRNYGTITITNHTILNNNTANIGGAINNYGGTITITNHTTLNNNTATIDGGAIDNWDGNTSIYNSTLQYNTANRGGAIDNWVGNTSIYNSTLQYNTANRGGAIYYLTSQDDDTVVVLYNSTFTENKATNGSVIQNEKGYGKYNITFNKFQQNTASNDKETLNLGPDIKEGSIIEDNTYENTDISTENSLTIPDENTKYTTDDEITLNFTIEPEHPQYYDKDILEKINKTLYINGQENITTNKRNHTLKELIPNKYEVYFIAGNQQSNTITFTVTGDSQIKTDKDNYEHYTGIKNTITLNITDPSKENGTINIQIKEDNTYKDLLTYPNVYDGYTLTTDTIIDALKNVYTNLEDTYTINITYNNSYVNPSSTEFTLNITKQRNTTITYDIINNTEGNVQINITVLDAVYNTPINDATINITGDINQNTTTGIITDNTLTTGNHNIKIQYQETPEYKESQVNIDFTVEIDKDKKIRELEEEITNLTSKLEEAQQNITTLENKINDLTKQLEEAQTQIETLENTNNNLTSQINDKNKQIEQLNKKIEELNKLLDEADKENKNLKDKTDNLTQQLTRAEKEIETLNKIIDELINRKPLQTTITINPIKSSIGSITTLSANITDENGDQVTGGKAVFKVNGITLKDENNNVIYARVNNGQASISYKVQDVWIKDTSYVEAVYGGTDKYSEARSKATDVLDISQGTVTLTLDKQTITAKAGQTVTLRAKILDATGDNINKGKVVFKLNGKTLKDNNGETLYAQVKDGEAVLDYTIPGIYSAKTYTLTAVYGGGNYQRAETTGKLILEKQAVTINTDTITTTNGKTTIKAKIRDETGKLLVTNTKLAIKINQKTILNNITSTNGIINLSFTTTLRPGTYELTIISGENSIYKKGTLNTVLNI